MPKVNYSSKYTENPPRLDRWDGLFLFLGAILMFTMISRIEYRVKAYMFYPNFLWRSFQFLVHFSIQKNYNFFEFFV